MFLANLLALHVYNVYMHIMQRIICFSHISMRNHEKSKKHREMVALLRQQLEEEDKSLSQNSVEREEEEDDDDDSDELDGTQRQK